MLFTQVKNGSQIRPTLQISITWAKQLQRGLSFLSDDNVIQKRWWVFTHRHAVWHGKQPEISHTLGYCKTAKGRLRQKNKFENLLLQHHKDLQNSYNSKILAKEASESRIWISSQLLISSGWPCCKAKKTQWRQLPHFSLIQTTMSRVTSTGIYVSFGRKESFPNRSFLFQKELMQVFLGFCIVLA